MIGPADARNMGIDLSKLSGSEEVEGISGVDECYCEEAYLVFTDEDGETNHYYTLMILISKHDAEEREHLPSLLGRDVLNRWKMYYAPHNPDPPILTFEVVSDDLSLPTD